MKIKKIFLTLLMVVFTLPLLAVTGVAAESDSDWNKQGDHYYYNFDNLKVGYTEVILDNNTVIEYRDFYSYSPSDQRHGEWKVFELDAGVNTLKIGVLDGVKDHYRLVLFPNTEGTTYHDGTSINQTTLTQLKNESELKVNKIPVGEPEHVDDWYLEDGYMINNIYLDDTTDYVVQFESFTDEVFVSKNNTSSAGIGETPIKEDGKFTFTARYNNSTNSFNIFIYNSKDLVIYTDIAHVGDTFRLRYKFLDRLEVGSHLELPETFESLLGDVKFEVNENVVTINVVYGGARYVLNKTFAPSQDMEIFDTLEAYYMNIDSTPQIVISHDKERKYLADILKSPDGEAPAFVPHSYWDLNTNQIKTIETYATNVYLKRTDKGVHVAYVYIDEFIMDKILSVHLQYTYRLKNSAIVWPIYGKYTDWTQDDLFFTSDDHLEYLNMAKNWQRYVPYWNHVFNLYTMAKTYELPRIDNVNWNNIQPEYNITKLEVEKYYREMNPNFMHLKDNPRYKLWAFALGQGADVYGSKSQIYHNQDNPTDPLNFHIMSIKYETVGKLYETIGSDQTLLVTMPEDLDGIKEEENARDWLMIIIVIVIAIGYILVLSENGGFKSMKHFLKVSVVYFVLILALYLLWTKFLFTSVVLRL